MMPRRRAPALGVALVSLLGLVGLVGLAACGVPASSGPQGIDSRDLPDALREPLRTTVAPTTVAPPTTEPPTAVIVYFIKGTGLQSWPDTVDTPSLDRVLALLERGPTGVQARGGARSALAVTSPINRVSVSGDTATIDLDPSFGTIPASDQILALGQIVLTATAPKLVGGPIRRVRLTVDGRRVNVPRADGTLTTGLLSAKDYEVLTGTRSTPGRTTSTTAPKRPSPTTTRVP